MDVLIVDDHAVVAKGIEGMLRAPMRMVHWAGDGESALAWMQQRPPHLAVVDLKMPGMGGLAFLQRVRRHYPHVGLVVFSSEVNGAVSHWLLENGVRAMLDKDCSADELNDALKCAAQGQPYLSRQVAQDQLFNQDPLGRLTEREYQVIRLLLDGDRQKDVAEKLFISHKTVSTYRQRAMDKLGLTTDLELARFAYEYGWIQSLGMQSTEAG